MAECIAVAVASSPHGEARGAYERHDWRGAVALYRQALEAGDLIAASDLERLGKAYWWIGDREGCLDAHERAYAAYLADGDRRRAAKCAQMLRFNYVNGLGDREAGLGWSAKAAKLLESLPECAEHGYQVRLDARRLCTTGNRQEGLLLYEQALEIGRRLNDLDLVALTETWKSLDLIEAGRVDEGFALVDELSAAAVGGELGPFATGIVLCNAISAEELEHFLVMYAAEAYLELGEIRLRVGDPGGAETAFRQAHALGRDPQPGQALLLLSRGEPEAAARSLQRALESVNLTTIERARMLEALVEVTLGAGDTKAGAAAGELEAVAAANPRQALRAMALRARASVDLAGGTAATSALRDALQRWQSLDAPYEVARTRMLLADSYCLEGDTAGARQELEAAAAAVDRLGASPDLARASEKLAALPGTQSARTNRAFFFSDIVDSTKLAEALGDETWADLLRWHDMAMRGLFVEHHGEEVDHAGDGFLVAFDSAGRAIACAIAVQRMLVAHRRQHGFAPRIRIGVHTAEAVRSGRGFRGSGVHQAARIAALAGADEVIASREAAEAAGVRHGEVRTVELKGVALPVEVVTLAWR